MQLLEITLNDFGVYQGRHTIDLEPKNKPIILFGGKNGAGKTTLLEAIRLCLYGKRALNSKTTQKEYEEHIKQRIHHRNENVVPLNHMHVSVKFEYADLDGRNIYQITRSWKNGYKGFVEDLKIHMNDSLLTNIAESSWQEFIEDIIPLNIANLFFFDGEKIQELAIENFGEKNLGHEIKRLFNIDLIETTLSDLDIHMLRQRKKQAGKELRLKFEEAQLEYERISKLYLTKKQTRSQNEASVQHINGKIEDIERQISQESSGYALSRNELKLELKSVEIKIEQIKKELIDQSANLLPFTLLPELIEELQKQLLAEAKQQQWQISKSMFEEKINILENEMKSHDFWKNVTPNLEVIDQKVFSSQLNLLIENILNQPDTFKTVTPIHSLSTNEINRLLNWIDETQNNNPERIINIGKKLDLLEQKRNELELALHKIPSDEILKPLMENLSQRHIQLGKLEANTQQLERELTTLRNQRNEAQKKFEKVHEELRASRKLDNQLELVESAKLILKEFLLISSKEKVKQLEQVIVQRFNELIRKPDLIRKVIINPLTFTIELFKANGNSISNNSLSAGERQMFAVALLWALRQISRRPFPVVIDTPLGRLDSEHRDNLIENYFPYVSHQLILFSTDTEVDQHYYETLLPHISKVYHMKYQPEQGSTIIEEGYFWQETSHAA
jgi:DNA sulfur modification protein DndD